MASKLRRTVPRVSFFSFQDMITSVTGILILVTMILTLYLQPPDEVPQEVKEGLDQARKELARARTQLNSNRVVLARQQLQLSRLTNQVFVIPELDPMGKKPILIVLSATNGVCTRLGETNSTEFKADAAQVEFKRLLRTWNRQRERLVFYLRPSAIDHFEDCRKAALEARFNIGYDAAEEDRQYVFSTLGSP